MNDNGVDGSSNCNQQKQESRNCEAAATCQVVILGAQRIRVAKILSLLQSFKKTKCSTRQTLRSTPTPAPPPYNGTHHILSISKENRKEFRVKVEFLPCVATFDSYNNERGEKVRYLSSVQYHGIDGKQPRGSSLAPFFDNASPPSTKEKSQKKHNTNQHWGIIAAVAGCGIEMDQDVQQIEQFLNMFTVKHTLDAEIINKDRQIEESDSCSLKVTLIQPNAEYSSMKAENEAFQSLDGEEKERFMCYSSPIGPGKMAQFVVKEAEKAIKGHLLREIHEKSCSSSGDPYDSSRLDVCGGKQVNSITPIDEQENDFPDSVVKFACKICRTVLFCENDLQDPSHDKARHGFAAKRTSSFAVSSGRSCESVFLAGGLDWMGDMSSFEGKIHCSKCKTKIGNWNWSGAQCSCGTWVTPAIQIPQSRVDTIDPTTHPSRIFPPGTFVYQGVTRSV